MTCPSAAKKSCGSHLFGVCAGEADRTALVQELSKAKFFCLRSPGEISHSNSPKLELSIDVSILEVLPRKVALHTSSHLTLIEAWRSAVSTTSEGRRVSSEARLENCTQVWGWAKVGQRVTHTWGKIALHTCSDLSKLVGTCLNQAGLLRRPSRRIYR